MKTKPFAVGVRVRLEQRILPAAVDPPNQYGCVVRVDARGVLVKLDSGRDLLVEPTMLIVIG